MQRWLRIACVGILLWALPVMAADTEDESRSVVIFSEVKVSGVEFVELYNTSDEVIDSEAWKLERRTLGDGKTWNTLVAELPGRFLPRGYYLIANDGLEETANERHRLGLSNTASQIRIVDGRGFVHDTFGWGSGASEAEGSAFIEDDNLCGQSGQDVEEASAISYKRSVDEDGHLIDTDNNNTDFCTSSKPSPESSQSAPSETINDGEVASGSEEITREYSQDTSDSVGNDDSDRSGPFTEIAISELLPDPDTPLTDAEDEYVELYNPHKEAVDLEDYIIETGMTYSYRFTLPDIAIMPGEYLALFSLDTNLTLSNTESQARLLDPAGETIFEVPPYQNAKPNTAWAQIDGKWQWSVRPTPGETNIAAEDDSHASSVAGESGTSVSGSRSYTEDGRNMYEEPAATESDDVDRAVVAGVGSLALLYAGYEYRFDIGNRFNQLKRYLASRRGGGKMS